MSDDNALVLLSGGQDSTTCLFYAKQRHKNVRAVTMDYGQRHRTEIDAACMIAKKAGVQHEVLNATILSAIGTGALIDHNAALTTDGGHVDTVTPAGLPSSFVPGRNMLFFTLAAIYAAKIGARIVYSGVCQTDYSGYPDCRREFVDAFEKAMTLALPSALGPIEVHTPLMQLTKAESVLLASNLPGCLEALAFSVTCYNGSRPGCGLCPACVLRSRGFAEAGVIDPSMV